MKSVVIIFAAILMTIATPFVFTAIDDAVTETATQSISGITTAAGTYSANVTLGRAMYNNDTQSVSGITSNLSDDSPTAYSYNSVSRILVVSGLAADSSRTLTIAFGIDSTTMPPGAASFWLLMRWFWIFAIVGYTAGAIYAFFD